MEDVGGRGERGKRESIKYSKGRNIKLRMKRNLQKLTATNDQ